MRCSDHTGERRVHDGARETRDRGGLILELLIAIVLLGLTVGTTLTALRTTTVSSAIERDRANSFAWLQSATDVLHARDSIDCSSDTIEAIEDAYRITVRSAENPAGWPGAQIDVDGLQYWNIDPATEVSGWSSTCDTDTELRRLRIVVAAPETAVAEELEVILHG